MPIVNLSYRFITRKAIYCSARVSAISANHENFSQVFIVITHAICECTVDRPIYRRRCESRFRL